MTATRHQLPEPILIAYMSGNLPHAYSIAVAAHISICEKSRALLSAHQAIGGAILEDQSASDLSSGLKQSVLDQLDAPDLAPPPPQAKGIYPAAVMQALKGKEPRWKSLGKGVKQCIISETGGVARLLYIPAGMAVPDHSHGGLEMTLVLQGAFSDETGRYGRGDIEIADEDLEHTPIAEMGEDCICLAVTDAPLRFSALIPRILQPLFRI